MLQKYKFILKCISPGPVRGLGGEALHGIIFNLLRGLDPELAIRLHGSREKPFSLSPLYGPGVRQKEDFQCSERGEFYFHLCCLNDDMCRAGELLAREWQGKSLRLGAAGFTGEVAQKKLPSGFDYHDLLILPPVEGEIVLSFLSPTSFRSQGRQVLFPLPEKVFGSLQRRWNLFSPIEFPEDTDFSFPVVSRYNLRTELVPFDCYKIIGFTGKCHYRIPKKFTKIMALRVSTLVRFAELAGCGYKTSMALGRVRLGGGNREQDN